MTLDADLSERRVIVTGASSGIGEVCRAVVERGGAVAMLARRRDVLDELARDLGNLGPSGCRSMSPTSTSFPPPSLGPPVSSVVRHGGSAAGQSMFGSVVSGDAPTVARAARSQPHRSAGDRAVRGGALPGERMADIVIVGLVDRAPTPVTGAGIYRASKSGLQAAVETLRLELAPAGISVGHVMPGFFDTVSAGGTGTVFDGEMPPVDIPLFVPVASRLPRRSSATPSCSC